MLLHSVLLATALGIPGVLQNSPEDSLPVAIQSELDQLFASFDNDEQAGMSVAVYQAGKIAYARGFGLASMEHGVPNTADTIFRIGSTSKQFTAACVVILSLMEELSLEDDIQILLPEMPDYGTPISIQNLLNHTSGLRDYIEIADWMGRSVDGMSSEECIAAVARQAELSFAPGHTYQYSNSNYLLLGEIVRRASGQSLAEFAEENIFGPLGMRSTHFHDRHGHVVKGRAFGYSPGHNGELELNLTKNNCVGDGGVFTTVRDMLRWDSNFYDEKLTGGLPFNRIMQTAGVLSDGSRVDYAAGLQLAHYGQLPVVMHGGSWVGYLAEFVRFPQQELSVICLANRSDINPTALCLGMARVLLSDRLGEAPQLVSRSAYPEPPAASEPKAKRKASLEVEELEAYVGSYHSDTLQRDWNISLEGRQLVLQTGNGSRRALGLRGLDCFGDAIHQVQFQQDAQGITGYRLWMLAQGEFQFVRR